MLTFGYILPRQAPVHNPYYSALLSYACALSFKELNENHLHIYPYPMSPTSMSGLCRLLCYRIRYKSSDYLSLARDRKYIIVVIILLSHGICMKDN